MKPVRFNSRQYFGQSVTDIRRRASGGARPGAAQALPVLLAALISGVLALRPRLPGFESARQLETTWAQRLEADGVRLRTDLGQPMTEGELQLAWACLQQAPETLRRRSLAAAPLELLSGPSIQAHPRYRLEQGAVPDRPGSDWSSVIGIAADDHTVVLANQHVATHGAIPCLLLHEVGHQFDRAHRWLSDGPRWQELHGRGHWRPYARPHPEESLAEAFADYFASSETRAKLPREIRAYLDQQVTRPWKPLGGVTADRILICARRKQVPR